MFSIPQSSPPENTSPIPSPQILEVTLKKPLWEILGSFFWGALKIILVLIVIGLLFQGSQIKPQNLEMAYEKRAIDEYWRPVDIDVNAKQIAMISAKGTIVGEDILPSFSEGMIVAPRLIAMLASAGDDPAVSAIVLRIDSPGGEVGASERITTALEQIQKDKKPVYVLLENIAASGGYYISTPAKKIYAYPETLLGNIGVRMDIPNIQGLMGKVGVEMQTVTSGPLKDMGSPFHAIKEEEMKIFQALIDESYQKFLQRVSDGRKIPLETVKTLADGRIYSGIQGAQNKLIDKTITSLGDLLLDLRVEMGTSVQLVEFKEPVSPWDEFLMTVSSSVSPLQASFKKSLGVSMKYE